MKASLVRFGSVVLFAALSVLPVRASDAVVPATIAVTNFRDEAIGNISAVEYYNGSSLLFTNCVLYAGTDTNSARQGLSNVAIEVKIGNTATSETYAATSTATNGVWSCPVTVPTFAGYTYVQIKVTDVNTNVYIYPWKILNRKSAL